VTVDYLNNLIPAATIIACRYCPHVWFQTAGEALATPTAVIRCPRCRHPVLNPAPEDDTRPDAVATAPSE
jgi:hypothetical protein